MADQTPETLDLIWGAQDIARFIGKTRQATYHMLEKGDLPGKKIGNQWVASRKALAEALGVAA